MVHAEPTRSWHHFPGGTSPVPPRSGGPERGRDPQRVKSRPGENRTPTGFVGRRRPMQAYNPSRILPETATRLDWVANRSASRTSRNSIGGRRLTAWTFSKRFSRDSGVCPADSFSRLNLQDLRQVNKCGKTVLLFCVLVCLVLAFYLDLG
jgi:hypothetical protein